MVVYISTKFRALVYEQLIWHVFLYVYQSKYVCVYEYILICKHFNISQEIYIGYMEFDE